MEKIILSKKPEICVLEQIQMHQMSTFKLSDKWKESCSD